jgi:hypothetical protein
MNGIKARAHHLGSSFQRKEIKKKLSANSDCPVKYFAEMEPALLNLFIFFTYHRHLVKLAEENVASSALIKHNLMMKGVAP